MAGQDAGTGIFTDVDQLDTDLCPLIVNRLDELLPTGQEPVVSLAGPETHPFRLQDILVTGLTGMLDQGSSHEDESYAAFGQFNREIHEPVGYIAPISYIHPHWSDDKPVL